MASNQVLAEEKAPDVDAITQQIQSLGDLRPFPAMAAQIMNECRNPQPSIPKITKMIECEPAISTRVLSLANSPLYGSSRPIGTIAHATVILGFDSVSQMALSVAAGELFSQGDPVVAKESEKVFTQSLACATVGRTLAKATGSCNPDEAFLCGVMHDIGKLIFFDVVPTDYCEILKQAPNGRTMALEDARYGTNHTKIGKRCGVKWGLPSQINTAIGDHHASFDQVEQPLSQGLIAAEHFARQWQVGFEPEESPECCEPIESCLGASDLASLSDQCQEQFAAVCEICAIG